MAKSRSKNQQNLYSVYKSQNRQAANRKRKLLKLQKAQPNNEQIKKALDNIKYRRCTPKVPTWSHTAIQKVMLFKTFTKGKHTNVPNMPDKDMFKLKSRAHIKGELVWQNS